MRNNAETGFLRSMVGKVIRVYKAGPESRNGKVLAVNNNILVLETEKDGIIYYNLEHIKSVCEESNKISGSAERSTDTSGSYEEIESLSDILQGLKNKFVRVDRGGPESRTGRLLGVGEDYFVINTKEDGVLYYQTSHVKSINEDTSVQEEMKGGTAYITGSNMGELLRSLQHRWIKINRGGPEALEGVVSASTDEYITMIVNKEVYYISRFHVRNFSYKEAEAAQQESDQTQGQNSSQNQGSQQQGESQSQQSQQKSSRQYTRYANRYVRRSASRYGNRYASRYGNRSNRSRRMPTNSRQNRMGNRPIFSSTVRKDHRQRASQVTRSSRPIKSTTVVSRQRARRV